MILSHDELVELVAAGALQGVREGAINGTSVDLHLGDVFLHEVPASWFDLGEVDLAKREKVTMKRTQQSTPFDIRPGDFVLAHTQEVFNLPDDISMEFQLKSSIARSGLGHLLAGWIDPGFNNSTLTLELHNVLRHNILRLTPGMAIGQVKAFRHTPVPPEQSYRTRGRYNGDHEATQIKE